MSNQDRYEWIRALECPRGAECDEESYSLTIEQALAERSNRRLRLLLATMEAVPAKPGPILPACAARLFKGLRLRTP